jgi:prephenate dehydrogenase
VGCHPLAGSEKSGAQFSRSGLYQGATCIITSPDLHKATKVVKNIWEKIGAKVLFMPAKLHDKILSSVSHLSHIVSFSLTNSVVENYLRFAPQSLKDMARISNSPSLVWNDIFLSNKKNILNDIKKFKGILNKFEQALRKGEKDKIIQLIENANKKAKKLN